MNTRSILVLNAGSSSIKFSLFALNGSTLDADISGQIEGIGTTLPRLQLKRHEEKLTRDLSTDAAGSHHAAIELLAAAIAQQRDSSNIVGIGHRIVHGGMRFDTPTVLNESILRSLEKLNPLAPLHQPHNIAAIRAVATVLPELPQVGCFDTAFHRNHDAVAELYALPYSMFTNGVRRYGFHGLSYEYIASALPTLAPEIADKRVIVAHLGNGASLCALDGGRSIDSTMGFSALDGLPMGTRCGQLDPGVILYLLREQTLDVDELENLLYKQSGLLGISGVSSDMRDLLGSKEPRAALAIDHYVFRIAREMAALTATLGGLDGIVFTAGIGENSAEIRRRICERLAWLGIALDTGKNDGSERCISSPASRVSVWALPTNEELMIALHTRDQLDL